MEILIRHPALNCVALAFVFLAAVAVGTFFGLVIAPAARHEVKQLAMAVEFFALGVATLFFGMAWGLT